MPFLAYNLHRLSSVTFVALTTLEVSTSEGVGCRVFLRSGKGVGRLSSEDHIFKSGLGKVVVVVLGCGDNLLHYGLLIK